MPKRRRLDEELVARGLFPSRDEAMRAVLAGDVSGAGFRFSSPGQQVLPGCELHVRAGRAHVSRGAEKLEAALDAFSIDPKGLTCLDVGCSTGGFTQLLLERGAAKVDAVDVGYAQFAWSLRCDSRVALHERTNICDLPSAENAPDPVDLAVCDVSFTSATSVLGAVCELLKDGGSFVVLVKPQFEAPTDAVGEGGVVRDPSVRLAAIERVAAALNGCGLAVRGWVPSPIKGAKGNQEHLLYAKKGAVARPISLTVRDA
ncbi:TlyA family RNA methyltransferase [Atopobiaceae bacterium 24-176]